MFFLRFSFLTFFYNFAFFIFWGRRHEASAFKQKYFLGSRHEALAFKFKAFRFEFGFFEAGQFAFCLFFFLYIVIFWMFVSLIVRQLQLLYLTFRTLRVLRQDRVNKIGSPPLTKKRKIQGYLSAADLSLIEWSIESFFRFFILLRRPGPGPGARARAWAWGLRRKIKNVFVKWVYKPFWRFGRFGFWSSVGR